MPGGRGLHGAFVGCERTLINSFLGPAILDSAIFYEKKTRWHITLFLLMPNHLHALL
jgi:hypothetical protein